LATEINRLAKNSISPAMLFSLHNLLQIINKLLL